MGGLLRQRRPLARAGLLALVVAAAALAGCGGDDGDDAGTQRGETEAAATTSSPGTTGRATSGRATTGRATSGRTKPGRGTTGRAKTDSGRRGAPVPGRPAFPAAIYRPSRLRPDWDLPGSCPSLEGVAKRPRRATPYALLVLRGFTGDPRLDRRLADKAYWPALGQERIRPGRGLAGRGRRSGPARRSPHRRLIASNCGAETLRRSWWLGLSPARRYREGAGTRHYFFLRRRGIWLLWLAVP